jgi:urea carboxylase-associated protein 2
MTAPSPPVPPSAARDEGRIEALRAHYESLRSEGQESDRFASRIASAPQMPQEITPNLVRREITIPAGSYWFGALQAGTCLRLDNIHGTPGAACLFWNAVDPSERFSATDTVKVQWTATIDRGRLLLSDMGRVLASVLDDTCGRHDALLGAGPPRLDLDTSPINGRNGAENLILGAAKLGLGPRDLHAPVTFFAAIRCHENRAFRWEDGISFAGTRVDLYAEMDLLIVVSNIPHPLAPAGLRGEALRVVLWRPDIAEISAFCCEASREAGRAFARTQAYLAEQLGTFHGSSL